MSARAAISTALVVVLAAPMCAQSRSTEQPPNFVVIFCDDLGYGDLGCFGHPTIRTPNLDRMAGEGQRWTTFYAGASVCTPSRAALLTGRLPVRNGMCSNRRHVLFPDSAGGLPDDELTIAELLKPRGYATACVGKWHLGHHAPFLPTRHGFDSWFGVPYSNDMDRVKGSPVGRAAFDDPRIEYWNVPLMRGEDIIERPADQRTLTRRYTDEAIGFLEKHRDRPFFLYLAHSMVHVPLFRSEPFVGRSARGLYGDCVEEIDHSTGRILGALRQLGLAERTLVVFTSDNGPWLTYGLQGGSAGLLRGGKTTTFEGGMREPTVMWWPGTVRPGVVTDMGAALDLLPTFCALAGVEPPADRVLDGHDLSPVLRGRGPSPRESMWYYRGARVFALRHGPFKAHFRTRGEEHDPPMLFHLEHDPSEAHDVASAHPEVLAAMREMLAAHMASREDVPSQLEIR